MAEAGHEVARVGTLATLDRVARDEGLMPPAVIMIGPVVEFRPPHSWFERRPLFGKRVLVTRPRHQAQDMVRKLEQLGAITYVLPAVEVHDPADWKPVDEAIARLGEYQWLVFTSANGVERFFARLLTTGRDLRAMGTLRLAAIGPGTAAALKQFHLTPDVVPPSFRSEELVSSLLPHVAGQ